MRTSIFSPALLLTILIGAPNTGGSQTFTPIVAGSPVTESGAWRSVNWVDYDRDGNLDLFVTRGKVGGQDNVLFRNSGPPLYTFTRMSSLVISQDHKPSDGSSWADIDNDGDLDCLVANWYNENELLYLNNGDGTLTQILSGPVVTGGGYSETGSWGDYDNDGLVDLYVANSAGTRVNFLFRNSGNAQFQRIMTGAVATDAFKTRGVSWIDYDDDGDLDLFAVNEGGANENLYRNMMTESGVDTFARVTGDPLVSDSGQTFSGSWGDYDNDGDLDVFLANSGGEVNSLFRNNGNGSFTKVLSGTIPTDAGWSASAAWGDLDNDGDLDLVVTRAYAGSPTTNMLYRNLLIESGIPDLQRITTGPVVTDAGYSYGVSWGDYDEDGDLDLFFARTFNENQVNAFYRNDGNANHWLTVECRGVESNAAAIGTKMAVHATINGMHVAQRRVIEGQHGYCGQNLLAHFGLGDAALIDSLSIDWPSGNHEIFAGLASDRHIIVVENDSTPVVPLLPSNGYLNAATQVTLKWKRSLYFPPYRVQVSTDSSFAAGLVADTIVTPDTTLRIRVQHPALKYFWRVKSARSVHFNLWSDAKFFDNNVTLPEPVQYLLPLSDEVNVPLSAMLRWRSSSNATSYHLRVATDSLMTEIVADTSIADTTLLWVAPENLKGYYWTVHSENIAGEAPFAVRWAFTTIILPPETPVPISPAHGAVNQQHPVIVSWQAALRAASYHLQVATDSSFVLVAVDDSLLTSLSMSLATLGSLEMYYWRVRAVNEGGGSPFSAARRFETGLTPPVLLNPSDGELMSTNVSFRWRLTPNANWYRLQYTEDSTFNVVAFDDSAITDTTSVQLHLAAEKTFYWRVRSHHPLSVSPWSQVLRFVTSLKSYSYHARAPWNLVSLPAEVLNPGASLLYPTSASRLYGYQGAYVEAETLELGRGYWVRLVPSEDVEITGAERLSDTIDVSEGWNLIGSISRPIPVSGIGSLPAGVATSPFYGFDGMYRDADTLFPGYGYWVKADQEGKLLLSAAAELPSGARITISSQHEDLPPAPPGGNGAAGEAIPHRFDLVQNYPNPFNPTTVIRYSLGVGQSFLTVYPVSLRVYDMLGRIVTTLVDESKTPGEYSVSWDASRVPSGVYYYRLVTGTYTDSKKMILLR